MERNRLPYMDILGALMMKSQELSAPNEQVMFSNQDQDPALTGPSTNHTVPDFDINPSSPSSSTNPAFPDSKTDQSSPGPKTNPSILGPSTKQAIQGPSTDPTTPGPSTNQAIPGPSKPAITSPFCSHATTSNTLTPKDIRPYLKAGLRKKVHQQRKKRKTAILTNTPVKEALETERRVQGKARLFKKEMQCNQIQITKEAMQREETKRKTPDDSSSEEEESLCLVCVEPFGNSQLGETWGVVRNMQRMGL
ncbi:hypothetical protein PAMA_000928 [Pampus argenteus]